jgi:tetratricopeptide (TPR) repeat protein
MPSRPDIPVRFYSDWLPMPLSRATPKKAIQYYEQFAQKYPHRAMEADELGQIYLEKGDFEKAKEHYDKIHILKPDEHTP